MAATSTAAIERSKLFDVITASYKAIDNQPISVDVQIPKIVKPGKHPLLVRFHGGGLVRHLSPLSDSRSTILTVRRLQGQACLWDSMLPG